MSTIVDGLIEVLCLIDDILILGKDQKERDKPFNAELEWIQKVWVTLNAEKCEFSKRQVTFLGHVINENGISADPQKTAAISNMSAWTNSPFNYYGKYFPHADCLTF